MVDGESSAAVARRAPCNQTTVNNFLLYMDRDIVLAGPVPPEVEPAPCVATPPVLPDAPAGPATATKTATNQQVGHMPKTH